MPALPDQHAALEEAVALAQRGEFAPAERLLRDLLQQEPALGRAWNALGLVLMQQGRSEEAEAALLRAAQAAPEDPRPHLNLGKLYGALRRTGEAERHLRESLRLAPASADAHFSLAAILRDLRRFEEAESSVRRAIELDPRDPEATYLLARLLLESGRFAQAEFCYREALRLQPHFAVAYSELAMVLLETGRLREAQDACREAIRIAPGFLRASSNYVMCGQYDPDATDADLLARARQAGQVLQEAAQPFAAPLAAPVNPAPATKLRLGIVSGDLHHHPVGLFLLPLLQVIARHGIDTVLYSNGDIVDDVSHRLGALAQWRDIAMQSDEQAWTQIRGDRPDVLIDLAGHTGNNRLALFAGRAAAVQLSWLGYFATTGTPNMDCVLMDPWHAPAGCEDQFTERVLRMPHTRFCFQPIDDAPEVAARKANPARMVFGSFATIAKVNEKVIQAWSRILQGTPGSRMVLKWRTLGDPAFCAGLAAKFQRAGIGPERIEFRPASDHVTLLRQYGDIDIALDTFPFTGGQTSFEAFWMGVPVVTLAGGRPASRQTLCVLGNLGLEELAAHTVDEFVERAVGLASDAARIADLRSTLRQRMRASPLMNAPEFAQSFTDILRTAAGAV